METFSLIMMICAVCAYVGAQAADLKHPNNVPAEEHRFPYEALNPAEIEF